MVAEIELSTVSAHVRYPSRDGVLNVLRELGVGMGTPIPVWPSRRLPYGIYLSPVRNGWVSLWTPIEDTDAWLPQLTAALECPGVVLEVVQSEFWIAEFFQDGAFLGRVELPTELVEWDLLAAHTEGVLEAENVPKPWDEELLRSRMEQAAQSEEFRKDVERLREECPEPGHLAAFLPAHARVEQAWELLMAIDHRDPDASGEEGSPYAEDYMDRFASYLGIRDAAWDPRADAEALQEGDYEDDEGLPEGWSDFVVMPVAQLPVL